MREVRYKKQVDFTPGGRVKESKEYKFTPDEEIKELLSYQISRIITKLFKNQLTQLEDIQQEHHSTLKRVEDLVSEDFIKMIDFLNEERHGYYRKKILDSGNETIREIERLLESFEIRIKK
tara:strand:+ start:254 stop:616 length:363 start_codon:yes stop_codon:yes gene_type:complete